MTPLPYMVLAVEVAVILFAIYALRRRAQVNSVARFHDMGNFILFAGYTARRIFFGDDEASLVGLQAATVMWAGYILYVAWADSRGRLA